MEDKRWHKQVPGGVLIEDDGGFINFFPSQPAFDPGMCLGFGMDDEDEIPVTPDSTEVEVKDNIIDFMAYKRKKRK